MTDPQQQPQTQSKLATALQQAGGARSNADNPFVQFRTQVNKLRKDIAAMIGDDKVDKFIRVCLNAVQYNPATLAADRRSLLLACMEAAQDGLLPDGNEAVFNIYPTKDKEQSKRERRDVWVDTVQYLPMAYGLVQKVYESGATYVDAVAVYDKDEFEYERGDNPRIVHKPYGGEAEPGKVVAAYCVVKYPKLETKREVMFRRDIEKVRSKSKQPDGLMWDEKKGFYDQGAIKSVIHRINKQLPQSERLTRALAHDNKAIGLAEVETTPDDAGADLNAVITGAGIALPAPGAAGGTPMPEMKIEKRDPVTLENGAQGDEKKVDTTTGAAAGGKPAGDLLGSGAPGTPEKRNELVKKMKDAKDLEALQVARMECDFFTWTKPDLDTLDAEFRDAKAKLEA